MWIAALPSTSPWEPKQEKYTRLLLSPDGEEAELQNYTDAQYQADCEFIGKSHYIINIAGLSGAGKSTLKKTLMKVVPGIQNCVSYTNRDLRKTEIDGVDIHWRTLEQIQQLEQEPDDNITITEHFTYDDGSKADYHFRIPPNTTTLLDISVGLEELERKYISLWWKFCLVWINVPLIETIDRMGERGNNIKQILDRVNLSKLSIHKNVSSKADIFINGSLTPEKVVRLTIKRIAEFIRKN